MLLRLVILAMAISSSAVGQRVERKNFKHVYLDRPTVPIEDTKSFWVSVHTGPTGVTKDTLRLYMGNMDILKTDTERLSKLKYFSTVPTALSQTNWNMEIEIAFGRPSEVGKETINVSCANNLNSSCKSYFYQISHELPTAIRIKNKAGQVLDAWIVDGNNKLQFGNQQIEKIRKLPSGGTEVVVATVNFPDEDALESAYSRSGIADVNRRAVVTQLRKAIESIYPRLYFIESDDKFKITSGSGKSFDYTDLTNAQEKAIKAIESNDMTTLQTCTDTWQTYLQKSDITSKDAMINKKVTAGLHQNLAIAYMYLSNFEKSLFHASAYRGIDQQVTGNDAESSSSDVNLYELISYRKKGFDINGGVKPSNKVTGIDLKSELGRRGKNKEIEFVVADDIYQSVLADASSQAQQKAAALEEADVIATEARTGGNAYRDKITSTATQGNVLMLNPFFNKELVEREMPSDITELIELNELNAPNMKFVSVPENLGNLQRLKKVNLKGSLLTQLPESIGKLKELKTLDLSNNKLTSLPESIKNCTSLKSLDLKGNPIADAELTKIKSWLPECKIK